MNACALKPESNSLPMTNGTMAPPEMAMHISPESSLAHSGFSSTVMENNNGQILAKPSPAAPTPAIASHWMPVIRAPAPSTPKSAERRKNARGLNTVSTKPPRIRPMVNRRKNIAGPKVLAVDSFTPMLFSVGRRNRPMLASAPTYRKMPNTARKKRAARASPGSIRCWAARRPWFPRPSTCRPTQKVTAMRTKNTGKAPRQPMLPKIAMLATALTRYEEAVLPMPLKPWAKLRFRL